MEIVIQESDMRFGEYKESQVFQIEKSTQYTEKLSQQGVRCCEFILLRSNKLLFVEAKRSHPEPVIGLTKDVKVEQYRKEVQEIAEKMRHSLELYASILLEKRSQDGLSDNMKDIKNLEMRLILVIKKAEKSQMPMLQDAFRKELRAEMHIWKIPDFFVLNEEQARKKHLII